MVAVKTLDETSFNFVAPDVGAMTLENLEDFVNRVHRCAHRACVIWDPRPEYNWDDYKNADLTGKVALLFLNEPRSDDQSFFIRKALTYYGGGAWPSLFTAASGACFVFSAVPRVAPVPSCEPPLAALVSTH